MDRMRTSGDLWTAQLLKTWRRRQSAHWIGLLLPLIAVGTLGLFDTQFFLVLLIIVTAALALFAPAESAKIVPFALLGYGGYGLFKVHSVLLVQAQPFTYGILHVGMVDNMGTANSDAMWLLLQAAACLVAGVWLLGLTGGPGGGAVRRAVAQLRGTDGQPRTVPALLLLPAIFLWEELFSEQLWFGWFGGGRVIAVVLIIIAVALVVALPRAAATLAVVAIALFGLYGALVGGSRLILVGSGTPPAVPYTTWLYGAVALWGQATGVLAALEGVASLGFAALLMPRLVTWGADAELSRRAQALAHRVDRLTQTRTGASEVAVAELRRIERDLHDGAQARLVAVGMSLRAAEQLMPTSPDAALALVAEARQTSSRALADLRDLVRGIYPPVLADRGLADAVRALALDTALAVNVDVDVPEEPPMPVAAAVYFGIAEAITNAVVHAAASTVLVQVAQAGDMLRVQVTDDGHGGADPSLGTGLAGVERRLAAFDGILAVSSPAGGPTIVAIEVPCGLSSAKTSTF
jgi:signal transduction histidine kinase